MATVREPDPAPDVDRLAAAAIAAIRTQAEASITAIQAIVSLARAVGAPAGPSPTAPAIPLDPDKLIFTVDQVAAELGISRSTVYVLLNRGELVGWCPGETKRRLITRWELERYLRAQDAKAKAKAKPADPLAPPAGLGDAARP
ncbi:MAG: helix-turn-helix domain-containing protein [Chloroflexota bacterium]|nr:helix-turn-helix domain-containing protein [Chloroflexota bacterium]